jgi:hypothetical protein
VKATLGKVTASVSLEVRVAAVLSFSGRVVNSQAEVVRTGSLKGSVSVHYRPIDGTAVRGQDYALEPGVLVFGPGVTTAFIRVKILDDHVAEGTETFTIELFDPSPLAALGRNASMVFPILDNDFGGVLNFVRRSQAAPRGSTVTIALTRSDGQGTELTVKWATVAGSAIPGIDFTPASGSVTFRTTDVIATFTVEVPPTARVGRQAVFGLRFPPGAARTGTAGTFTLTISR